jgi:hypothetical protein
VKRKEFPGGDCLDGPSRSIAALPGRRGTKFPFKHWKATQRPQLFCGSVAHRGMGFRLAYNFFRRKCAMKKLVLLTAAAAFIAPALIASASAETVSVRVGSPGYRAYSQERVVVGNSHHCRMTTVRTKHANGSVTVRKIRKCN